MKTALHVLETLLYASVWLAALFIGLVSLALTGCGGKAHATVPAPSFKIDTPFIVLPAKETPATDANRAASPPVVLRDILAPPKAAVRIDANTYRACTCGDNCRCANCPDDCNTLARGDCPGGVCMVPMGRPQRSVIAKSSPVQASSDCAASGGVRGKVRAVGSKAWNGLKGAGKFVVRRFRR